MNNNNLDGRIRDDLQCADDEKEQLHDLFITSEHIRQRILNLLLNLKLIEPTGQFDNHERERS